MMALVKADYEIADIHERLPNLFLCGIGQEKGTVYGTHIDVF